MNREAEGKYKNGEQAVLHKSAIVSGGSNILVGNIVAAFKLVTWILHTGF